MSKALQSFAKFLAKALKDSQLSEEKFGEKIGVHRQMLRRYLAEKSSPKLNQAERICECLGSSLGEILGTAPHDVMTCHKLVGERLRELESKE